MSYYTGQGDYYSGKGDPGILGSIFGAVKGGIGGLISGGPLGAVSGAIGGLMGRGRAAPARLPAVASVPLRIPQMAAGGGVIPTPGIGGTLQRAIPGGATGYQGCAPGYHVHKTEGDRCVRNRHMNPANSKALRRAIRREGAFVDLAKRALKGSGYTFKKTRPPTRRRKKS